MKGFRGCSKLGPPWCRETPVCRAAAKKTIKKERSSPPPATQYAKLSPILPTNYFGTRKKSADTFKLVLAILENLLSHFHTELFYFIKKNTPFRNVEFLKDCSGYLNRLHTEKSFWNLIKSTRNQIVFAIFRLIWSQTDVRLVPNQSENGKYDLISVWFIMISKRFLCV